MRRRIMAGLDHTLERVSGGKEDVRVGGLGCEGGEGREMTGGSWEAVKRCRDKGMKFEDGGKEEQKDEVTGE